MHRRRASCGRTDLAALRHSRLLLRICRAAGNRRRLENVRRAGFDGAPPDIGDIAAHPTAGASVVGARGFLIAYNVDLETRDADVARLIARKIRESSGGFRFVKAMGLYLPSRECAQVSMNLTNFAEIPMEQVYLAIATEAASHGTSIKSSQLIGLIPKRAFDLAPDFFVTPTTSAPHA